MSEKITNLMRDKFGFSKVSQKISIKSDDSIYQIFQKVAKYIYKNGVVVDDWSQEDYIDGIKHYYKLDSDYDEIKVEQLKESKTNGNSLITTEELNDINSYAQFNESDDTKMSWRNHVYKVTTFCNGKTITEFVFVDPLNTHVRNDTRGWYWTNSARHNTNFAKQHQVTLLNSIQVFNAKIIIGAQKLIKDMNHNLLNSTNTNALVTFASKLGMTKQKAMNKYYSFLLKLQNPRYRSKGYKYLFEFDGDFAEAADKGKYETDNSDNYLSYDGFTYSKYGFVSKAFNNYVISKIDDYLHRTYSLSLQAEREINDNHNSHARFFQEKKNISLEKREVMKRYSNSWSDFVKGVEIDNEGDLTKLHKLAPEIKATLSLLPKASDEKKPILRFRKLRNLKALGVFTNFNDTIALEFRITNGQPGIESFIHEYGHFLDYHTSKYNLSTMSKFMNLIGDPATRRLEKFADQRKISNKGKYGLKYYCTPTEIFARAFELYISHLGLNNSLISDPEYYQNASHYDYACFKENEDNIYRYFDDEFPELRQKISDYSKYEDSPSVKARKLDLNNHEFHKIITVDCDVKQLSLF